MPVLEERDVVSTGGSGVALAWLAGRERPWTGRDCGRRAGDRRGRLEGWMARRPVICGDMLTARVEAGWPGPPSGGRPGCAVGAGGTVRRFPVEICMIAGVGRGSAASLARAGVVRRSPRLVCSSVTVWARSPLALAAEISWGQDVQWGNDVRATRTRPGRRPTGDRRPEQGRRVGARAHRDPRVVSRSERCR